MSALTFTRPPRALRRARPDNLALVPANLLPFKGQYQAIANDLPTGTTLIVVEEASGDCPCRPGIRTGSRRHMSLDGESS